MARALLLAAVLLTAACGEPADDAQLRSLVTQAGTHLQAGRHTEAIHAFERALSIREELPTLLSLAQLHAAAGRWSDAERYLARAKVLSPLSTQVQLGLADAATAGGRWDEARALYRDLADRQPLEVTPRLLLAALADTRQSAEPALRELGAWRSRAKATSDMRELHVAEAMLQETLEMARPEPNWLERARSAQVDNVERAVRMARIYLRRTAWTAAEILLEGAAMRQPHVRPHFVLLAAAAIEAGDAETARQAMARVDQLAAATPVELTRAEDIVLRARIDIATGHAGTAHDRLQAAIGRASGEDEDARGRLRYWLARSLLRLDAVADARKELLLVSASSTAHVAAQLELAQIDVAGGELDAARARLEAIAAKSAPVQAHLLLARLHDEANDTAEAERVLRRALVEHPRATSVWLELARLLQRSERSVQARATLDQVLRDDPTHPEALGLQAQLVAVEDAAQAIVIYRKLLSAHPTHAAALNNLALLLSRAPEGLAEAVELAQQAFEARPADPRIADTLGWVHHLRGAHELARPLLERALAATPGDPSIEYHLGAVLLAEGERKRGAALLRAALVRSTSFEGSEQARALLSNER